MVRDRGADRESRDGDRRRDGKQCAAPSARAERDDSRSRLGGRPGRDEQVVDALQPRVLRWVEVAADEIVELGRHRSSSSSASASRESALRVRVLTVPSGISRRSAISLCESPLQYASSITGRSWLGQDLERAVDAPGRPGGLGLVGGIRLAAGAVDELGRRAPACAAARP